MHSPDHHITKSNFGGLRVAAFESRMAEDMRRLIERYGGRPLVAPSMQEVPLQDNHEVLQFGEHLMAGHTDMVILLTGVGARTMLDVLSMRYGREEIDRALSRILLVVRGPKPKAVLREAGLAPTIEVPEPNTWRDILHTLDRAKPVNGLRIVVQEYGVINPDLLAGLRERGAHVSRLPVYRWTLPDDIGPLRGAIDEILAARVDVLLITNAVQLDHVLQVLGETSPPDRLRTALSRMVVASIGPTASERLRSYGFPVDLEPSHPKMGILVKETADQAAEILERKRTAPP